MSSSPQDVSNDELKYQYYWFSNDQIGVQVQQTWVFNFEERSTLEEKKI